MIKKVVLFFVLIFSFFVFDSSFASWSQTAAEKRVEEERASLESAKASVKARQDACDKSWNCLDSPNFTVPVTWMFNFWSKVSSKIKWETWEKKFTSFLWIIIQKMMVVLWVVSLFIMTVWAWYIIIYHWEDELLSKWKNIFIAWIISLVVALTSYYMVSLVRYIIYN